jgi:LDH2 family malate/lactate/ureidoglycolate dehydrogenase
MVSDSIVFDADHLRAAVQASLIAAGVPSGIASVEAAALVESDLCGVPSHGVIMLTRLLTALRDGRATAAPELRLVRDGGATCVLDGDNGPGRWVAMEAMDLAVARAGTHGIGLCLAVRTTHWGRAHAFATHAARRGYVGICTTNAIPTLAPPGATKAVLGNNPLAIAMPRGDGQDPLVLDLAMTQAAFGKVATYRREGRTIPDDWGCDATGQPTTDPSAILSSGLLAPMGGHKGLGLALMMELLTAGLSGGPLGHEILAGDQSGIDPGSTKIFIAIDPQRLGPAEALAARIDQLVTWIKSAGDGILAPGERGWQDRARHLRDGVPVHRAIVEQLAAAGVTLGPAAGPAAPVG